MNRRDAMRSGLVIARLSAVRALVCASKDAVTLRRATDRRSGDVERQDGDVSPASVGERQTTIASIRRAPEKESGE